MKTPLLKKITSLGLVLAAGVLSARADALTWDPALNGGSGGAGTWNFNTTANWFNGATDVKWLDNSATGTNSAIFSGTGGSVALNTSLSTSNLQFLASGYTLAGSGTLTLGAGGIDASALGSGATTIGNALTLAAGQQLWQAGSGSTLAINGTINRTAGATVDFSATGITSTTLANVNGILGGWATVGAANGGSTGDWAANDGSGNIITYAGYTVGTAIAGGGATDNWLNTANGTVTANATINSLNQQADVTVSAGATLTLNSGGLMLWGVSRWMLASSTTTSFLKSGLSTGELFVHVPYGSSGNNWTLWPVIADAAVPAKLVKDGAGLVKLGNNINTYSGGTIVNGGVLASRNPVTAAGLCTPFGTGPITVNNAQLRLGTDPTSAAGEYDITNSVTLNGGTIYESDAFQHVQGPLIIGVNGGTLGSTFNNKGDALNKGFGKGLFVDGLLSGTGNLTVQQSGIETVNAWDSSTVYFTSPGTAAQNTYSGTITVNPFTLGGSYLYLIGTNVLANATINLAGDNSATTGRYGSPTLLFGSGTNLDGVGYGTIGGLSGTGSFPLANTKVVQSGSSLGAAFALTVGNNNSSQTYSGVMSGAGSLTKIGNGTLTLSGANTYTGNTIINGGALVLNNSFIGNSTNITVGSGATFDVSALGSITLGGSQTLSGSGTNNGSIYTTSGSKIYAGTDGGYGTNRFNNDLNLAAGALVYFDVGTLNSSTNDRITVAGTLSANNNVIHLKAPSAAVSLQAADYVLFTAGAISGSFVSAPFWDVQPLNAGNFSVVTSGNTVTLHYAASTAPKGGGSASPATVTRNQSVFISVTATNGTGGTINSVVVDASPIGGSASLTLVAAGGNIWTNTVAVTPDTLPGSKNLVVTLTDTVPLTGLINIPLTVTIANDVWNGAGANDFWSSNLNWTNKAAPGYIGDSLQFSGTTRLTPSMDNNYSVTGVTFDSTAGSFNVGTANGSTLTLTGSGVISNNSFNAQILNVPVADAGNGLVKAGGGALTLAANTTLTGLAAVSAGRLVIPATGNFQANANPGQFSSSMVVGSVTNVAGDLQLNSGALTVLQQFAIGNGVGSSATFEMNGGTASLGSFMVVGFNNDRSLFSMNNGSLTINNNLITVGAGGTGSIGVANISGGTINSTASTGYGPTLGGLLVGEFGSGTLNVSGNAAITVAGRALALGVNAGSAGRVNLQGGILNTTGVSKGSGAGTFNFNGGTLQAGTGSATFLTGLDAAYVYGGGAFIDDAGNGITVGQPLLAPAGYGVSSISLASGGSGYIAPPIVVLTNGTGSGATATAQINPVSGVVTGIVINNPGSGYAPSDVLTVTFFGGGGSGAAANAPVLAANASGGLIKLGGGTVTLSGASTYSGSTVISNGTLSLTGSINNSTNIIVGSGATFDVSGITYTLGGNQSLSGSGFNNGTVNTTAGSRIYAGTDGGYGTNTFYGDLSLISGAAGYLDLGTAYGGTNDQIIVNGTLTANNNVIHLKAPSTSVNLDTTADYVLITAGAITGSFASAPGWDVAPANAGHYSIVTGPNSVTLHYNAAASAPTVTASANPTTLLRNQPTRITANVTPGSASISAVAIDLSPLGGSTVSLVRSNASNVYTNTVPVPATAAAGSLSLTVTATDSATLSGSASVPFTIITSAEVWNGAGGNQNWSTNPNWVSTFAPGYSGDDLLFAGTVGLAPNMDANYTVNSLTFSNNAGSFNIGTANSSTLTLAGGAVVNKSANAQTLNVPVTLNAAQTFNAAAGNLTLGGTIADAGGGLTKTGNNSLILSGYNTFTGPVTVSAGTLAIPATGFVAPNALVNVSDPTGVKAVLNIAGGNLQANSNPGQFTSSLTIGSSAGAVGDLQLGAGGTFSVLQQFAIGAGAGGYAAFEMSGGTATIGSFMVVGFSGDRSVFSMTNGSLTINNNLITIAAGNSAAIGVANISGGTFSSTATTGYGPTIGGAFVGEYGSGTLNVSGNAAVTLSGKALTLGVNSGANGVVNLNGGVVNTTAVSKGGGNGTLNFNGGTLQASAAGTFLTGLNSANVFGGGAILDDGGNAVTVAQPLLAPTGYGVSSIGLSSGGSGYFAPPLVVLTNGTGSGATATAQINPVTGAVTGIVINNPGTGYLASDVLTVSFLGGGGSGAVAATPLLAQNTSGGLTKQGAGTLTLSGANTYTGNTTVNAGTLEIAQPVLAGSSTVTVAGGAILQLDFAVTNRVSGLVLNGVTQAPGVYNLATSAPYIAGTGSLLVSTIASNPTNITFSVTGHTLALSWPADHLGWILQSQTNSLNTGLSTNWFDVAGSATVTSTNINMNPAVPTAFYRLRQP